MHSWSSALRLLSKPLSFQEFWTKPARLPARKRKRQRGKVKFRDEAEVYEFERQLFGGCAVPDDGAISLGLGNLVRKDVIKLSNVDKDTKDTYACEGFLEPEARAGLLAEWLHRKLLAKQLTAYVQPLLDRTRRERHETVQKFAWTCGTCPRTCARRLALPRATRKQLLFLCLRRA